MISYSEYANREQWLSGRQKTLGASEVASALSMGFQTPLELWKQKTGRTVANDLSDNERVQYGTKAEEFLRALFALQFRKKYVVRYHAYRIYTNDEIPHLSCTLDGELEEIDSGRLGILEIKTAWITSKYDLDEWDGKIKQSYYCQVLSQMKILDASFAVVWVQLIFPDGHSEIRHYEIERSDVEQDIEYVVKETVKFWRCVENDEAPSVKITL